MNIERLNEYRIDYADNTSEVFMAQNGRSAMNACETDLRPVAQLTRVRVGVGVEMPIRYVKFNMIVTPETAAINRCYATPETYVVPEGTEVIFTAIPAQGFEFIGWFKMGEVEPLSTDFVTSLRIDYPENPSAITEDFEARFTPITMP